ncbi:MAG: ribbon-helix-helix domain-containing protein [Fimbriimonadaceae bacterium]|nr:ribbon-helix-helix domain-containing protein [Fimbriimonadaceae bacterium]
MARGRPKKEVKKIRINLAMDPKVNEGLSAASEATGVSKSQIVEDAVIQVLNLPFPSSDQEPA